MPEDAPFVLKDANPANVRIIRVENGGSVDVSQLFVGLLEGLICTVATALAA